MAWHERLLAITSASLLAWFIGAAMHVRVWSDWQIGDRCDMAFVAGFLVFVLTRKASA